MLRKLLFLAPIALAFDFTGQPDCAVPCLKEAIAKANCDLNMQCICPEATQEAIRKDATSCVLKVCAPSDLAKAQKAAVKACASFTPTQAGAKTHSATTISSPVSTDTAGAASRETSVALIGAMLAVAAFFSV